MKLRALSHYDGDKDTRFGDCILVYDNSSLIVYDCGHAKHAEYVESFLLANSSIVSVHIVVSHKGLPMVRALLQWCPLAIYPF